VTRPNDSLKHLGDRVLWESTGDKTMATEYSELEDQDREAISAAMDAALQAFRQHGLNMDGVDHCDLLDALVDVFEQATR
jgi:hypothetical protein